MIVNIKVIATILISSALSACGGGLSVAGNDGISGTGITAVGRVTGFGSICVNGIKFEVKDADFYRDGVNTTATTGESDFSLGEYITINGTVSKDDETKGTASEVIFENQLEGAVTEVSDSSDNYLSISVLGQKVQTDVNTTILIDARKELSREIKSLSTCERPSFTSFNLMDLSIGNIVEVSGVKYANGLIKATSIKWKEDSFISGESENEVKGTVTALDTDNKTFMLGSIQVSYEKVKFEDFNGVDLSNSQFVEVKSSTDIVGNTIIASSIKLKEEYLAVDSGHMLELEGVVTRFNSILDFDINGVAVTTNSGTIYDGGASNEIQLNSDLEVKGTVNNNGVLVAEIIEFED